MQGKTDTTEHPKGEGRPRLREKRQVVAGFVVFRRTEDGIKYLLLYKRGSYWNFPKGHFEEGEESMATALRETEEETGIKPSELRIIPGFKAFEKFAFRAGNERIHDTVILFLAETRRAEVRISPREHSGFGWFTYQDAIATVGKKYLATKHVLKQAHDFIHRRRHSQHASQRPASGHRPRRRWHPPHPRRDGAPRP
jgi:8-oxo-dGTP pyrophosphatase MutT (NUDIX family)